MLRGISVRKQKIRCQKDIGRVALVDIRTFLVERQDIRGGRMKISRRQLKQLINEIYKDYDIKKRMDRLRSIDDPELLRKINMLDPKGASIADMKQAREFAIALGSIEDDSPFLDIKLDPIENYMWVLYYSFLYAYVVGYSNKPNDPISKIDLFKTADLVLQLKPGPGSKAAKKLPKGRHRLEAAFKKMIREKHIITNTLGSGQPMYIFNNAMKSLPEYN